MKSSEKITEAKETLEILISQFPGTPASQEAIDRLKSLPDDNTEQE